MFDKKRYDDFFPIWKEIEKDWKDYFSTGQLSEIEPQIRYMFYPRQLIKDLSVVSGLKLKELEYKLAEYYELELEHAFYRYMRMVEESIDCLDDLEKSKEAFKEFVKLHVGHNCKQFSSIKRLLHYIVDRKC